MFEYSNQAATSSFKQDYRSAALFYTDAISAAREIADILGITGTANAGAGLPSQEDTEPLPSEPASHKQRLINLRWARSDAWVRESVYKALYVCNSELAQCMCLY